MSSGGGTGGTEAREHLANERTLLAWVRTGVSLISFGLVIERIGAQVGSVGTSGLSGLRWLSSDVSPSSWGRSNSSATGAGYPQATSSPLRRPNDSCGWEPGPRWDVHSLRSALCLGAATSGWLEVSLSISKAPKCDSGCSALWNLDELHCDEHGRGHSRRCSGRSGGEAVVFLR